MIFSAGCPSRSYIARRNNGAITIIISNTAGVFPIVPRVNRYIGIPVTAAVPKQINCLFVIFNATLVLILFTSRGIAVKAIDYLTENFFSEGFVDFGSLELYFRCFSFFSIKTPLPCYPLGFRFLHKHLQQ